MKKRLFKTILYFTAIIAAGLCYALFIQKTGFAIPCVFRLITGLKCPGCGVTTMALCLLRLDFVGAFSANPVALCLLPYMIYLIARRALCYIKGQKFKEKKIETALSIAAVIVLILFGIIRNI